MKNTGVSTLKVAAAYIGTVVGAGFATGQEILQFFNRFGCDNHVCCIWIYNNGFRKEVSFPFS